MTGEPDGDLPLHDEAMARSKWRGDEALPDKGEPGTEGPASEGDDAAQSDGRRSGGSGDDLLDDLARRPPD